ncbi:MAG: glycosyltransferase family 4 protein [Lachnospiraceae bacterium]
MKKLGFIIPWFSDDITGGAELALKELVHHLQKEGVELEILTTCVKNFSSDWNKNYYSEGMTTENGIVTRRFIAGKRDARRFDVINAKLMNKEYITELDEDDFMRNMVHSSKLYDYIKQRKDEYSLFVFTPYMFGTTYEGVKAVSEKSVLIPCFHDESYAYMQKYIDCYKNVGGMIFLAKPEAKIANRIYDLSKVKQAVLGTGVDIDLKYDAKRFREKFKLRAPFILYTGRKDTTKNVGTLIYYFTEYKKYNHNECKLIMMGPASLPIPKEMKKDIIDLGFVDLQDKYDAMAAATVLCQPSVNESFSLVIMESWLCGRPVMVHEKCAVTKNFVIESNGGFYFSDYYEFEKELNYLLHNTGNAEIMGRQGGEYVRSNFAWDVIVERYMKFFEGCSKNV